MDKGPNIDIIPPPIFTHMTLPFNYAYSQNPYVRITETGETINTTAVKHIGYFIGADDPAPDAPQEYPDMTDYRMVEIVADLEQAFEERPVWTRRSLMNHLGGKLRNWNELKKYLNYTAYQFKGGPWRDGVVPYGIDPRTDPKYRIYQTLMFKLSKRKRTHTDQSWQSHRRDQAGSGKVSSEPKPESHIFDGETYHSDGKVWQVCDITDPLLKELLDNAEVRSTWNISSGWYYGGLWAKVKAIMKTKLVAVQFGRHLTKEDFAMTLNCGNRTPTGTAGPTFHLPLPNLCLTEEEKMILRGGGGQLPKRATVAHNKARIGDLSKAGSVASGASPAVESQDTRRDAGEMDVDDEESENDGEADEEESEEDDDDDDEDEDQDDDDGEEDKDTDEDEGEDDGGDEGVINNQRSQQSDNEEAAEAHYPDLPATAGAIMPPEGLQSFYETDALGTGAYRYSTPPIMMAQESEGEEEIEELTDVHASVYPELE